MSRVSDPVFVVVRHRCLTSGFSGAGRATGAGIRCNPLLDVFFRFISSPRQDGHDIRDRRCSLQAEGRRPEVGGPSMLELHRQFECRLRVPPDVLVARTLDRMPDKSLDHATTIRSAWRHPIRWHVLLRIVDFLPN